MGLVSTVLKLFKRETTLSLGVDDSIGRDSLELVRKVLLGVRAFLLSCSCCQNSEEVLMSSSKATLII